MVRIHQLPLDLLGRADLFSGLACVICITAALRPSAYSCHHGRGNDLTPQTTTGVTNMIKLSNEIRELTVQLSNEDLDKVSGGLDQRDFLCLSNNKAVAGEKSAAVADAYARS
jgi:hypothetical protein